MLPVLQTGSVGLRAGGELTTDGVLSAADVLVYVVESKAALGGCGGHCAAEMSGALRARVGSRELSLVGAGWPEQSRDNTLLGWLREGSGQGVREDGLSCEED